MNKTHLAPLSRSHTTWTETAETIRDEARKIPNITRISCGPIKHGVKSSRKSVKIFAEEGCLLLRVVGNHGKQEMRIYAHAEHMRGVKDKLVELFTKLDLEYEDKS